MERKEINRIVVKVGTSVIADDSGLKMGFITSIAAQVAEIKRQGIEVVLVSSGAIATGKTRVASFGSSIVDKQAAAIFGQPRMAFAWIEAFEKLGLEAGAPVYKDEDLLNVKYPLLTALKKGVIVVNGNDAVYDAQSEKEIISKDNDKLARYIATMIDADILIMLTEADGVLDTKRQIISTIDSIADLGRIGLFNKTQVGTGGMNSKIQEARSFITNSSKISHIAGAKIESVILRILMGERVGTKVTLPLQGFLL